MKAWQYTAVSGKLEDSLSWNASAIAPDKQSLAQDGLIIEVISASLNPVDYKLRESGFIGRRMIPRPAIPGLDFHGRVIAKHDSTTTNKVGQLIFGGLPHAEKFGCLGQFLLTSTAETAPLPDGVGPNEAAATGTACTTAYQSLLPDMDICGWQVFLNGGSGGVGSWAVQIARARGAHVTVSCSTANVDFCKGLGAVEVIDYKQNDVISVLKEKGQVFDLVVDNVGIEEFYANRDAYLKHSGWFCQVGVQGLDVVSMSKTIGRSLVPDWWSELSLYSTEKCS